MKNRNLAYLLDMRPISWTSREEFHARLCSALRAKGASPVLIVTGEPEPEVRTRLEEAGAELYVLPYAGLRPGCISKLRRIFAAHRISAVHIRYFAYFSELSWLARLCGVRRILFTEANSGVWRARPLAAAAVRMRTRIATRPITRIIAISEFVKARLTALGTPADKIVTIYNGIDLKQYKPDPDVAGWLRRAYDIKPGEVVISTIINGLRPLKRPDIPIKALHFLAHSGLPVRLVVAGDGPMRSELCRMAETLGVASRVIWLGYQPEPWRVLQGSDVFTLATEGEAFGFAIAEAMACGLPVVGARSGAIPELVEDGRTGFLAAPGDARDFADKLRPLVEDAAMRNTMGSDAIRCARRFDVETAVSKTVKLYESVL